MRSKDYIFIRYFHFGWSLIHYYKKNFGVILALFISIFYIIKIIIKTFLYFFVGKNIFIENKFMIKGIINSFFCNKDFFRNIY